MNIEIPSRKMPPSGELFPVYVLQWATADSLARMAETSGGAFITQKRFEQIVNAAKRDGYAMGEAQGRANLRADIESGEVPPVERRETP